MVEEYVYKTLDYEKVQEQKLQDDKIGVHIFKLLEYNNPVLYDKNLPYYNFTNHDIPPAKQVALVMEENLKYYKGYGLSANQIGINFRIFSIGYLDDIVTFFNPEIIKYSEETSLFCESCLSFPGLGVYIKRPNYITLKYQDFNGEYHVQEFSGLTARIIVHEFQHILGEPFFKGISKIKLEAAVKKAKKYGFNYNFKELMRLK